MKHGRWTVKIKKASPIKKIYWDYKTNTYSKERDYSIAHNTIISKNGSEYYTDVYGLRRGPIDGTISFSYTDEELAHFPYEILLKGLVEGRGMTMDDLIPWPWFRYLPPSKYEKIKGELKKSRGKIIKNI